MAVWARLVVAPPMSSGSLNPWRSISFRDMDHLVERRRDEAAEADHVCLLLFGACEDLFAGDHDAKVDDIVVVARKHDADNVLADVVDIAFDGREDDLALRFDDLARGFHRGLSRLP